MMACFQTDMMNTFSISKLPKIEFGAGKFNLLPDIIKKYPQSVLFVSGSGSFEQTTQWRLLKETLDADADKWFQFRVEDEPSPALVDKAVQQYANESISLVLAVGGGSVLDAAKAIAGLLRVGHSVMDFLEGVGPELTYEGPAVPFIAVPTTAGTGSETTKNAVLSVLDKSRGFKKSFRDEMLVANYAIVDPDLLNTCPKDLIAANGMDALTQLLESFVSLKSNPMIDALALSGLQAARDGLLPWYNATSTHADGQAKMAYAAMLSGITLAQVGLGSVHGLASPMGAFFPIPHGVVCGTLLADATAINIKAMLEREPDNIALEKYAQLGRLLCNDSFENDEQARNALLVLLRDWTDALSLPQLHKYGVKQQDLDHIVKHSRGSSMKTNPIVLKDEEIKAILQARL